MACTSTALAAYFNSRPCGRGDACPIVKLNEDSEFQFTPLREGRPIPFCRLSLRS